MDMQLFLPYLNKVKTRQQDWDSFFSRVENSYSIDTDDGILLYDIGEPDEKQKHISGEKVNNKSVNVPELRNHKHESNARKFRKVERFNLKTMIKWRKLYKKVFSKITNKECIIDTTLKDSMSDSKMSSNEMPKDNLKSNEENIVPKEHIADIEKSNSVYNQIIKNIPRISKENNHLENSIPENEDENRNNSTCYKITTEKTNSTYTSVDDRNEMVKEEKVFPCETNKENIERYDRMICIKSSILKRPTLTSKKKCKILPNRTATKYLSAETNESNKRKSIDSIDLLEENLKKRKVMTLYEFLGKSQRENRSREKLRNGRCKEKTVYYYSEDALVNEMQDDEIVVPLTLDDF